MSKIKRTIKWIIIFILISLVCVFFFDTKGHGTGSYRYARRWKAQLSKCNSLDDVKQQFNCGRNQLSPDGSRTYIKDPNAIHKDRTWALLYKFPDGDWMAIAYANSHGARGGGTVVTKDSNEAIRIFFGHVCGHPFAFGESLNEIYSYFETSYWREIFLN